MPVSSTTGLPHGAHEDALMSGNDGGKTEFRLGMSKLGLDSGTLSSDALGRVYPIRSIIGIEPPGADSVSSSSREPWSSEGAAYTPVSEEPSYGWIEPGWTTKFQQTADGTEAPFITTRFAHRVTKDGHMVVTGVAGAEKLQRCEDEPIHAPGAVQGFGALLTLHELEDHSLKVRIASENSKEIIGYSPSQLFALHDFCEILSDEQTEEFFENLEFIRGDTTAEPEVFSLHIIAPDATVIKLWCALSVHQTDKDMLLCEFELEEDMKYPVAPLDDSSPAIASDTLKSDLSPEDIAESTKSISKPLRILKRARQSRGEIAALNVYRLTSQIQDQFGAAKSASQLLGTVVGVVRDLTKFHRVMIYQFDSSWNGKVVTELVDFTKTKDLYKGLYFPASDIPKQARELYRVNKVRLLYDRDLPTARLVCKSEKDLQNPLDMTHSYLRAMSPIHLKYLEHMDVRASMSISITCNGKLWGLISCHTYGNRGMRITFPLRKMCMIIGEAASRNVERLTDTSKLQARKLINAVPTEQVPSGYIVASSEDLLKVFDAAFGILSIHNETKLMGRMTASQEALALLEYLRIKCFKAVVACQHISGDYPDLRYPPGFQTLGGFLLVPLSGEGTDFIVFFRKWQLKQVHWAGNPYEKKDITGHLMPRKSFKLWIETVRGKCSEWTEDQVETAAVLCLVYGKFIEVWRQKEAAIQTSQMTKILLANASHELRTPLNAIINFMEIALEGPLDKETRDNLSRSHVASKSLIYAINDLLDLTRTEQGQDLIKEEDFNLIQTVHETVSAFNNDIVKKGLKIEVIVAPDFPVVVKGDEMRMRQCISNLLSNAVKYTNHGGISVELRIVNVRAPGKVDIEIAVEDTGIGINAEEMDTLFRQLEQVQLDDEISHQVQSDDEGNGGCLLAKPAKKKGLGLGIAKVGRIIQTIGGQLRVTSEKNKGSRFTMQMPLSLPVSPLGTHSTPSLSPREAKSEKDLEVTLVDFQSKSVVRPQRPQLSRRASHESPGVPRHHSASEIDRLVKAMQTVVPGMKRPPFIPFPSDSETEKDTPKSTPSFSQKLAKRASQPNPPKMSGLLDPLIKETANAKKSFLDPQTPDTRTAKVTSPKPFVKAARNVIKRAGIKQGSPVTNQPVETNVNGTSFTILVAEDDPVNSLIIKRRMERMGYTVKLTVNGQQCADEFKANPEKYDLVLMDMQMPILDGGAATALIRRIELSNENLSRTSQPADSMPKCNQTGVPIFAISASLEESKRLDYMETGFDGWLLKPVDFKRLQTLIKGITDLEVREEAKYTPGKWGIGGWLVRDRMDGNGDKAHFPSMVRRTSMVRELTGN